MKDSKLLSLSRWHRRFEPTTPIETTQTTAVCDRGLLIYKGLSPPPVLSCQADWPRKRNHPPGLQTSVGENPNDGGGATPPCCYSSGWAGCFPLDSSSLASRPAVLALKKSRQIIPARRSGNTCLCVRGFVVRAVMRRNTKNQKRKHLQRSTAVSTLHQHNNPSSNTG